MTRLNILLLLPILIIYSLYFFSPPEDPNEGKYVLYSETVKYTYIFDKRVYTYQEIQNADLLTSGEFSSSSSECIGFYYEGELGGPRWVTNKDELAIDQQYQSRISGLQKVKPINEPFWIELKEKTLRRIEEEYRLKKQVLKAYTHPEVLYEEPLFCPELIDVINSADTQRVLRRWKAHLENSGYWPWPEKYIPAFHTRFKTQQEKFIHAKEDLVTLGLCCSLRRLPIPADAVARGKFEKLFKRIEEENLWHLGH